MMQCVLNWKSLEEAQLTKLYNKIEKLKLHSKLYNARRNELVGVSDSSRWPKKGNIGPRNEAMFYYCHDRNLIREADERACRDKSEHQNKNDVKIRCNRSQIFISEKIKKMIPLIEVEIRNDEDSVNHLKTKNNTLYMLEGGTKFVEPTINLNEESDLEEKTGMLGKVYYDVSKYFKRKIVHSFAHFMGLAYRDHSEDILSGCTRLTAYLKAKLGTIVVIDELKESISSGKIIWQDKKCTKSQTQAFLNVAYMNSVEININRHKLT
ncbi:hypothetical protein CWI36_0616p0010 [Hamiltosporidium magnivora]|uniref:Uncharacterized protein n=1 Tax=Hamiltosporidium magnivora TaxID=148818 RepID=A0A4Q9LCI0_9MICR|nr:hypothetical protein CWI36_0616p0010 [Hamiltosporidium magnivora]